jgi:hypothetical protein
VQVDYSIKRMIAIDPVVGAGRLQYKENEFRTPTTAAAKPAPPHSIRFPSFFQKKINGHATLLQYRLLYIKAIAWRGL